MLAEGSEEGASTLINTMADIMISKDKSQWQAAVDGYKTDGKTEGQAFGLALGEQALALGVDMLGGALSGGVMAGGNVAINKVGSAVQKRPQTEIKAETAVPDAPKTIQEAVQQQISGKLMVEKPMQVGTVELDAPTVQVSDQVWQQSQRLAAATGRKIRLYEGAENVNGSYDTETGTIWVNTKGGDVLTQVFSHEMTHSLEKAGAYGKLSEIVLGRMQATGIDLDVAREAKRKQYERQGHALQTAAEVDQELVAEYVSKYLLTDEASIVSLVKQDRTLGQRIKDWFDGILAKLGNKNAQERAFLVRARDIYAKALRQTQGLGEAQGQQTQQQAVPSTPMGEQGATESAVESTDDYLETLNAQLAAGEITDDQYDTAMDEYEQLREERLTAGERKYSISDIQGQKEDYGQGVILDTDIFDGVRPRAWGEVLSSYVYNNLAGTQMTVYDEAGNAETIHLAKENDRVRKDGAKNAHKVIDKLARYTGDNTKALATIHLSELLETSRYEKSTDEHSHQWMDENGWDLRKTYIQDRSGRIYEATLNIAKGRDRNILYAISNVTQIDKRAARGDVPSTVSGRGSLTKSNSSVENVAQAEENVKQKFSLSDDTVSKKDVARELQAILQRGGDVSELKRYVAQLEGSGRKAEQSDRSAEQKPGAAEQNGSEAEQILEKAKRRGVSVEQYLQENAELYDVDGTWNEDARKALELEKNGSGRKYSVSEDAEAATAEEKSDVRSSMPKKAKAILDAAERTMQREVTSALHVPSLVAEAYLAPVVQELSDIYLDKGTLTEEDVGLLFDKFYANGVVACKDYLEKYSQVAERLRGTTLTPTVDEQRHVFDYKGLKEAACGKIRIASTGGITIAEAYQMARNMQPDLFPDDIETAHSQAWRLVYAVQNAQLASNRMEQIKSDSEAKFREKERTDFDSAVSSIQGKLWEVKRFAEDKTAKEKEAAPATAEEANTAYQELKKAKRALDRAKAKNLLTEQDEMQVGRLLRHEIELEHLNPEKDNVKGIAAVFEAKQEYERLCKLITEYKQHLRGEAKKRADSFLQTANDWKDKKMGIAYSRETMERNIFDIVKDKALAQSIIDQFFTPVHKGEAAATRFKNDYRDRVRALQLSTKVAKGNLVSEAHAVQLLGEAHAVQLLGEAEDNIRMLENTRGRIKNRDGKNLSEWRAVVEKLWAENPNLDKGKIEKAVKEFRHIYDALFQEMNRVRVANGYEPVNYRNGYFPHFQPGDSDSILAQFGRALGIDTRIDALPTAINGLTHTFKPGIQWFGNAQERLGFNTAYDAVEGFDKYIEGVASVIYQTANIQNLRALASQIRYRTSNEGIREQVDAIQERPGLSEEEKQQLIQEVYAHGKFTLSNFVTELDEYTNLLANKKSRYDRSIEAAMGRKAYTFLKAWEARVGANMIAGNLTSALTNFIPLTQAGAQMDRFALLNGMLSTLKAYRSDDGIVSQSTFLTNRRGSDPLVQTWAQKASGVLGKPMEVIDGFVSDSIVRGAYLQNLKKGMSEAEAMDQADAFASSVMADRSKGAMPTLMQATNPLFKAFTQFQLEVNNQFSEVFKDIPRRFKEKGLATLAWVLLKYFLGAWLYNELYEELIGRRPALDPIGMLCEAYDDLQNDGFGAAGANLAVNALEQLPFSSGLTLIGVELDGGRIPASSAVPDLTALWSAATTEGWSAEKRWKEVQDELWKLAYVVPPFGGNQISKTVKGAKAYFQGGSYAVEDVDVKDEDGNVIGVKGMPALQYPVYKDEPKDAFWNFVKAAFLGKSSLDTAQD